LENLDSYAAELKSTRLAYDHALEDLNRARAAHEQAKRLADQLCREAWDAQQRFFRAAVGGEPLAF
jgi:hypothetical protein